MKQGSVRGSGGSFAGVNSSVQLPSTKPTTTSSATNIIVGAAASLSAPGTATNGAAASTSSTPSLSQVSVAAVVVTTSASREEGIGSSNSKEETDPTVPLYGTGDNKTTAESAHQLDTGVCWPFYLFFFFF